MNWERDVLHRVAANIGEYVYHGTNEDILDVIVKDGLKPMHRGLLSFSKTMPYAESFALEGMTPYGKTNKVILRVKSDYFKNGFEPMGKEKPKSDQLYEVLTKEIVPPYVIEILQDGTWVQLVDMIKVAKTSYDITDDTVISEVMSHHRNPDDFDEGDLAQRITRSAPYKLMDISIDDLNLEEWEVREDLVDDYVEQYRANTEYPPIVVSHSHSIIDGIHRANALDQLGIKTIKAYVGAK